MWSERLFLNHLYVRQKPLWVLEIALSMCIKRGFVVFISGPPVHSIWGSCSICGKQHHGQGEGKVSVFVCLLLLFFWGEVLVCLSFVGFVTQFGGMRRRKQKIRDWCVKLFAEWAAHGQRIHWYQNLFSFFLSSSLIPCGKFRWPYLGKVTAATRAALSIPNSTCVFLCVSRQRYGCQCLGSLTCTQMLMLAIAPKGCIDTVRECTES